MKCLITSLLLVLLSYSSFSQFDNLPNPQLSANTKMYLFKQQKNISERPGMYPEYVYREDAQHQAYISTLIQVYNGFQETNITALGAHVGTKAGNIWTVQVPIHKVNAFTQTKGIKYIELDQPLAANLDTARKLTRVDSVHAGYGLPKAYTGKDVVVGIIDLGFDYTHPSFYDTAYAAYRLKRVWEEKAVGTPPVGFSYGNELNDSLSIITKAQDVNNFSHGSHVAGIAGGSGAGGSLGNNTRFRGVAYNSDLVFVSILPSSAFWLTTGMADMLDGMQYIYNYANSVSKPAVANLSWGGPLGPRDGNSLFSQACDNITGSGKLFAISAGNNGANRVHLQKTFTNTDSIVHTCLNFNSGLTEKRNWVDVWGDTSKAFRMRFSLYSTTTNRVDSSVYISLDNSVHQLYLKGTNGDTCFIKVSTVSSEFNAKPHMLVEVYSRVTNQVIISVSGKTGTIDMWNGLVKDATGYYTSFTKPYLWLTQGDLNMQVGDMACSKSAVAVASYNSKPSILNVSGATLNYGASYPKGAISSFSSHGPTTDARIKPDITGPGMMVVSSINSVDPEFAVGGASYNRVVSTYTSPVNGNNYSYAALQGTSMSSPFVSGVLALLLEANPTLNPQQVISILANSAITDSYTGVIPSAGNATWGAGKVNAYSAIKQVLQGAGIYHSDNTPLHVLLYPNPTKGNYSIEYQSEVSEIVSVEITNVNGQKLMTETWKVQTGTNNYAIDLSAFAAGVYFTKITNSKTSFTIKIVKQ